MHRPDEFLVHVDDLDLKKRLFSGSRIESGVDFFNYVGDVADIKLYSLVLLVFSNSEYA